MGSPAPVFPANLDNERTPKLSLIQKPLLEPDAVRRQLAKILASPVFADSGRMIRFLRFAVEETLRHNDARLKEIVIGTEVFDRAAGYDPRLDPIVRVEARRLRAKLSAYYEEHGREDAVVVELPKGQYAPVFLRRTAAPPEAPAGGGALAVLPFLNLTPAGDAAASEDYFSDGLSEDLIRALTRVPGLRVVAWSSAAQIRENQEDLATIRESLHVAYILRGSVRRTQGRLRINAHLIETNSGQYAWSESYDRDLRDVLSIQEEIAAAIATALKLRFQIRDGDRTAMREPSGLECYHLYLKGRYHANDRTAEGLRRSVVCFEQAIALGGSAACAHSGLADSYALMADYGFAEERDALPKAKEAAMKALALDPQSAEAHASLAFILCMHDWQWEESERGFQRAIALNPAYAAAHHWYAVDHLALWGRFDQARTEIEVAIDLDPLVSIQQEGRAFIETLARRYDDAIAKFAGILAADPSYYKAHTSTGRVYIQMGRYEKAIQCLQRGRELGGDRPHILGAMGQAQGLAGRHKEARGTLAALAEMARTKPVHCSTFALVHLGLGECDRAMDWLERGAELRQAPLAAIQVHPAYDALRGEPRFQALTTRIFGQPFLR